MMNLKYDTAASLATEGHIYCAGTLAQCLRRWDRLPADKKTNAFLSLGRDGEARTILRGEDLSGLVTNPDLVNYRWR